MSETNFHNGKLVYLVKTYPVIGSLLLMLKLHQIIITKDDIYNLSLS